MAMQSAINTRLPRSFPGRYAGTGRLSIYAEQAFHRCGYTSSSKSVSPTPETTPESVSYEDSHMLASCGRGRLPQLPVAGGTVLGWRLVRDALASLIGCQHDRQQEEAHPILSGSHPKTLGKPATLSLGRVQPTTREEFLPDVEEDMKVAPMSVRLTPHVIRANETALSVRGSSATAIHTSQVSHVTGSSFVDFGLLARSPRLSG